MHAKSADRRFMTRLNNFYPDSLQAFPTVISHAKSKSRRPPDVPETNAERIPKLADELLIAQGDSIRRLLNGFRKMQSIRNLTCRMRPGSNSFIFRMNE